MKKVAKLVVIDPNDNYLILSRTTHPRFGDDPDLPGGTHEANETPLEAMIREVKEEVGVRVDADQVTELYSGKGYSLFGTYYTLFSAKLAERPTVTLSWEHSSYEWVGHDVFLERLRDTKDSYMKMVREIIKTKADIL